jgi:hypothetical protein
MIAGSKKANAILFSLLAIYILLSFFNYSHLEEDSFIYFRVAENIVNGHGHVYNVGDEHTEVGTSETWLLLLVLFAKLGFNILIAAKPLEILFGSLSLYLTFKISQRCTDHHYGPVFCVLLTALSYPFLMYSQLGLGTTLFTFVLLLYVYICINKDMLALWPFAAVLLIFTRPEGMLIILGVLPAFFIFRKKPADIIRTGGVFLFLVGALILGRFLYFHDFLPQPFYFKIMSENWRAGLPYAHRFLLDNFIYILLLPLLHPKCWKALGLRLVLLVFIVLHLLWVVLAGGDYKPHFRHCVPIIPIIYIFAVTGIFNAYRFTGAKSKAVCYCLLVALGIASLLLPPTVAGSDLSKNYPNIVVYNLQQAAANPVKFFQLLQKRLHRPEQNGSVIGSREAEPDTMIALGEFLRKNYAPGTTFVYDQMGRVPFQAGNAFRFIDSNGLTDKHIGRYGFYTHNKGILKAYGIISRYIITTVYGDRIYCTKKEIMDYFFAQDPDVIMHFWSFQDPILTFLTQDKRFTENYEFRYSANGTFFYEKKSSPKKKLVVPAGVKVRLPSEIKYRNLLTKSLSPDPAY